MYANSYYYRFLIIIKLKGHYTAYFSTSLVNVADLVWRYHNSKE